MNKIGWNAASWSTEALAELRESVFLYLVIVIYTTLLKFIFHFW